jgi:asparagine synthase (glutamine-hydrolysing)
VIPQIHIKFAHSCWYICPNGSGAVRGTAFKRGSRKSGPELLQQFPSSAASVQEWMSRLNGMNGFFAAVSRSEKRLIAAVDKVRSIPLFYGQLHNHLYLSDDAEWVRQQVGDTEMDPVSREEFLLTGYVTGQDTLFATVKQLQAGECLLADTLAGQLQVITNRYFRFLHTEPSYFSRSEFEHQLDRIAKESVERLAAYADGRQIVIPLSGGYDSRLVALLLKRIGYENILSFNYCRARDPEATYSRQIANALGIPWLFVEYSSEKWRKAWQTTKRIDSERQGSGWSGLPNMQGWLALQELTEKRLLQSNCVLASGDGGFVAGGHIPDEVTNGKKIGLLTLSEAVMRQHYFLAPWNKVTKRPKEFWRQRIAERAEAFYIENKSQLAEAFEKWEWQERQAKFIVNSVRVYEAFGYDWWLPLWDAEFMSFWQSVPLELRIGKNWYINYVKEAYLKELGIVGSTSIGNASEIITLKRRLVALSPKIFNGALRKTLGYFVPLQLVLDGRLKLLGRFSQSEAQELLRQGFHTNGIHALSFILSAEVNQT